MYLNSSQIVLIGYISSDIFCKSMCWSYPEWSSNQQHTCYRQYAALLHETFHQFGNETHKENYNRKLHIAIFYHCFSLTWNLTHARKKRSIPFHSHHQLTQTGFIASFMYDPNLHEVINPVILCYIRTQPSTTGAVTRMTNLPFFNHLGFNAWDRMMPITCTKKF